MGSFPARGEGTLSPTYGENGLSWDLTVHLTYYVLTMALGVMGLWRLGESFMSLGRVIAVGQPARKPLLDEAGS